MHVESAVCLVEIETHLPCLVLVDLVHCSHLIKLGEESRDRGGGEGRRIWWGQCGRAVGGVGSSTRQYAIWVVWVVWSRGKEQGGEGGVEGRSRMKGGREASGVRSVRKG